MEQSLTYDYNRGCFSYFEYVGSGRGRHPDELTFRCPTNTATRLSFIDRFFLRVFFFSRCPVWRNVKPEKAAWVYFCTCACEYTCVRCALGNHYQSVKWKAFEEALYRSLRVAIKKEIFWHTFSSSHRSSCCNEKYNFYHCSMLCWTFRRGPWNPTLFSFISAQVKKIQHTVGFLVAPIADWNDEIHHRLVLRVRHSTTAATTLDGFVVWFDLAFCANASDAVQFESRYGSFNGSLLLICVNRVPTFRLRGWCEARFFVIFDRLNGTL